MRILPVIDLMNGVVVRGVAGRRHEYRPIVSRLTGSVQPLDVAQAFRDRFGLNELYLADLDAIAGQPPSSTVIAQLLDQGFVLWVDAGVGEQLNQVRSLAQLGVRHIIAGLESLGKPDQLRQLFDVYGGPRLVFSLDLRDGRPLAGDAWHARRPWDVAETVVRLGVGRMLVLDLAAVGTGSAGRMRVGVARSRKLCERLRAAYPALEISTGGGVRDVSDLRHLRQIGVDNVLVASALHDGCLTVEDLESCQR